MATIRTTIDIAASREVIWSLLTDTARYPEWNPTVAKVEGTMAQGETVTFYPATSPGRGFKTKVVEYDPESRMVCRGGMPLGLFSGSRTFQLGEAGRRIRFEMIEEYSGVLEGLITRTMGDQQPTFDEFAASLKKAAEARAKRRTE